MLFSNKVVFAANAEACIKNADACVIITEWNEFRAIAPVRFLE